MAGSFAILFMGREGVEVHKHAKREQGQYPAILMEQAWSIMTNEGLIIWDKTPKNDL